ncbi:MAG: hypothetical protein QOJ54_810 [Aliidongia sp.]|jgi:hypothetical protein|nr:hypothetical protein [Aliidongia sp.]
MSRFSILALFFLALSAAPLSGRAEVFGPGYVPGTEDVPLMPGLAADAGTALIFDKPQGRIVEAAARGPVSRRAVLAFYQQSLPQLGWLPAGDRRFQRDGERLSLDFDGSDGNLLVGFTLSPH